MSDQVNPRAFLGVERRRQMQVRGALNAALAKPDLNDTTLAPFLLACAEYLIVSLQRLDFQDMAISDRLIGRVPKDNREVHDGLAALSDRQAKARAATDGFAKEVQAFKSGKSTAPQFVGSVRAFAALIQVMMQPRRNPYEKYTNELFTDADWVAIGNVTPQVIAAETHMFARVRETAPPGIDPDAMPVLHGGPPR